MHSRNISPILLKAKEDNRPDTHRLRIKQTITTES